MAKHEFFKTEFDKWAVDGFIGHPNGAPAYAYLRVSSDEQGEEGRSGLPRQIEHVHQKAYQEGCRITWEMVFADDYSGFELERPELSSLRRELRLDTRRAGIVVMEHLDRLSRNADWHQGFLLDEMKQLRVAPLFWKSFHSRIERAVMGAISQEGMEQTKQRMIEGMLHKARDGRVTARVAAYGYRLVDEHGRESERAKRFTYYAIREDEAAIMRRIYQQVAGGTTLRSIGAQLTERGITPPKRSKRWEPTLITTLVKNPVYKGEFIARRWMDVKIQKPSKDGLSMRTVKHRQERPEEEWIRVPVPAIVDAGTWQAANDMLAKNKAMARRNAKEPYLLTGLVKCATCGFSYTGVTNRTSHGKRREQPYRGYRCPNAHVRARHNRQDCDQGYIAAPVLDDAVWEIVCKSLLEPESLIHALEAEMLGEQNAHLERQIAYLERELALMADADEKLYRAYMADVFDEQEYAARRMMLKEERATLTTELASLRPQVTTRAQFEERKALIIEFAERVRRLNVRLDVPFENKQRIIKMVVNRIVLNVREQCFRVEGVVKGAFPVATTQPAYAYTADTGELYPIVNIPIDSH
jgi:site-specific DNA recombinase